MHNLNLLEYKTQLSWQLDSTVLLHYHTYVMHAYEIFF